MSKTVSFHTSLLESDRDNFKKLCKNYGLTLGGGIKALIRNSIKTNRINGVATPKTPSEFVTDYAASKPKNNAQVLNIIVNHIQWLTIGVDTSKDLQKGSAFSKNVSVSKVDHAFMNRIESEATLIYPNKSGFWAKCCKYLLESVLFSATITLPYIRLYHAGYLASAHSVMHKHIPATFVSILYCAASLLSLSMTRTQICNVFSACEHYILSSADDHGNSQPAQLLTAAWIDDRHGNMNEMMSNSLFNAVSDCVRYYIRQALNTLTKKYDHSQDSLKWSSRGTVAFIQWNKITKKLSSSNDDNFEDYMNRI